MFKPTEQVPPQQGRARHSLVPSAPGRGLAGLGGRVYSLVPSWAGLPGPGTGLLPYSLVLGRVCSFFFLLYG